MKTIKKKKKERNKHALDQESDQVKTITVKKKLKKTSSLDQESDQEEKKNFLSFFLTFLFSFFEDRPQISAKKVPLFVFASIRCGSFQNV